MNAMWAKARITALVIVGAVAISTGATTLNAAPPPPTPAPTAEHYWYLAKTAPWSFAPAKANNIGIAARLYPSSHDCESTKSRWEREARHAYLGLAGLLAEKHVEDEYYCIEDTNPVWMGRKPESKWFLFTGIIPHSEVSNFEKHQGRCTVKFAISGGEAISKYFSDYNFETLQSCFENSPFPKGWPRPGWARAEKEKDAEAFLTSNLCWACVRGNAAIFQRAANGSGPEGSRGVK
jgi:hypothetical protein